MIISISGLINSGKDTIAKRLVNQHGFVKDSFAASLKDAVAAMFGWDREMLEGATPEARAIRDQVDTWWAKRLNIPHLTPRWVLQNIGTNVLRNHFHQDIWLASLERRLLKAVGESDIVITDSRYQNEMEMLSKAGATMVQVQRGELPDWWDVAVRGNNGSEPDYLAMEQSLIHPTEWSWAGYDFDVTFLNNGTIAELEGLSDYLVDSPD